MTTIVENSSTGEGTGTGTGMLVGIVLVVMLLFVLFGWGIPAMRGTTNTGSGTNSGGTQINVPDRLDVNVNKAQ